MSATDAVRALASNRAGARTFSSVLASIGNGGRGSAILSSLNARQHEELVAHADQWSRRTRDNTTLDATERRAVEAGIARYYELAGTRWHGVVHWVKSPWEAELAAESCAEKLDALARSGQLNRSRVRSAWLQLATRQLRLRLFSHELAQAMARGLPPASMAAGAAACIGAVVGLELGFLYGNFSARLWSLLCDGGAWAWAGALTGALAGFFAGLMCCVSPPMALLIGLPVAVGMAGKLSLQLAAHFSGLKIPLQSLHPIAGALQTIALSAAAMSCLFICVSVLITVSAVIKALPARGTDVTTGALRCAYAKAAHAITRHVAASVVATVQPLLQERIADPREALRLGLAQARAALARGELDAVVKRGVEACTRHIVARYMRGPVPLQIGAFDADVLTRQALTPIAGPFEHVELAALAFYRTLLPSDVCARAGELLDAVEAASRAGPWWPNRDFVIVVERHHMLCAQGSSLHRADGPALHWPGLSLFYSHGTPIPRASLERPWHVDEIAALTDASLRRAVIEYIGWPAYIERAGLIPLAQAGDPGNPGRTLLLYEAPPPYTGAFRLLVMTNGSTERDGTYRVFAERVPNWIDDPIEAVAWTYNCSADVYQQVVRRT